MRIISKENLCTNRPYINLKKLTRKSSLRVGEITRTGFKSTYIINQRTQKLSNYDNYTLELDNDIKKVTLNTFLLNEMLLVDVSYSTRNGNKSAKFKVYFVLDNVKYALPYSSFADVYENCMNILTRDIYEQEELTYIKESFNSLENDEIPVDINLNLERLKEFKAKVDYKRNVYYFVINNVAASTSKYDINSNIREVISSNTLKVLRYNHDTRLYTIVKSTDTTNKINLQENDIICDLSEDKFAKVSIYTDYGLGKLLDVKNNVIPNANTLSLFANILDLKLAVLN